MLAQQLAVRRCLPHGTQSPRRRAAAAPGGASRGHATPPRQTVAAGQQPRSTGPDRGAPAATGKIPDAAADVLPRRQDDRGDRPTARLAAGDGDGTADARPGFAAQPADAARPGTLGGCCSYGPGRDCLSCGLVWTGTIHPPG